jgi:hypothetical protein
VKIRRLGSRGHNVGCHYYSLEPNPIIGDFRNIEDFRNLQQMLPAPVFSQEANQIRGQQRYFLTNLPRFHNIHANLIRIEEGLSSFKKCQEMELYPIPLEIDFRRPYDVPQCK